MPKDLFFSDGSECRLGHKHGVGGEGAVYEIISAQNLVAKIYHRAIDYEKQKKLIVMSKGCDDALKSIAAWPVSNIHRGRGGPICGFAMPKITGYEPIHKLYGPTNRKQIFPKSDWAFLVHCARNIAAAFKVIHLRGHVIADINQGNIVVSNNSTVKLIDCDSFQIINGSSQYLCNVGVAHFTPPELQAVKSFHSCVRTMNHDNFGLALLCFHLLFMGRHPFSGVYSGTDDMPIEKAIKEFRFAFGREAKLKGMNPPPNSVGLEIIPSQISLLFERAFSFVNSRPNASEWISALEILESQIRTCQVESVHKYYGGLNECPWCKIDRTSGIQFFISITMSTDGSFNLSSTWQRIVSSQSPGEPPIIDFNNYIQVPKPLPPEIKRAKMSLVIRRIASVGLILWCISSFPSAFFFVLIISLVLFFSGGVNIDREKNERRSAFNIAKNKWDEVERKWKREAGDGLFREKLQGAANLKTEYENLSDSYNKDKQVLQNTIKERQLHRFLDKYFIADHSIPQIGSGRKATLASFGIETAADINYRKIISIRGFGAGLTSELMSWQKNLINKFTFDPTKNIDPADLTALDQKYRQKKKQIEDALLATPESLNRIRQDAFRKRQSLRIEVENCAIALAQAKADLSIT